VKRRRWRFGSAEIELVSDVERRDAGAVPRRSEVERRSASRVSGWEWLVVAVAIPLAVVSFLAVWLRTS
jgi:hypothetical protein